MTQLLISVKNVDEALLALHAGADVIDLKEPSNGALSALDIDTCLEISNELNGRSIISAAVGEQHLCMADLVTAILNYHQIGVDIIKFVASELFTDEKFEAEILKLSSSGIKMVAVFFADESLNLQWLKPVKNAGFFGVMLDTKNKYKNLLQVLTKDDLQLFTQNCQQYDLKCGFAGSLRPQHIDFLMQFNPTYLGFRGGVCKDFIRSSVLSRQSVLEAKKLLLKHNNFMNKPQRIGHLAL